MPRDGFKTSLMEIKIGNLLIGPGRPCFIVAEMSGNHRQSFELAVKIIEAAAEAGADAVKLQTYTPDTLTIKSSKHWFRVGGKDQPDAWMGETLYDLYEKAYTPWDWQPKLKKIADELGLILFSTPFDEMAVDFLESMDIPCYKIASYEAIHIPLLKRVARTGKPVILSVGFASLEEVGLAVNTLGEGDIKNIAVLHCVTAYSDKPNLAEMNLSTIEDLRDRFRVPVGFSDNNIGIEAPVVAASFVQADVIEKHLILNRSDGGPDARFSMEPAEFKEMVRRIRKAEREGGESLFDSLLSPRDVLLALGKPHYGPASKQEAENMFFRPSIWVKENVRAGESFSKENMRVARPSAGLAPKFFDEVVGKKATQNIEEVTPLSWDLVLR